MPQPDASRKTLKWGVDTKDPLTRARRAFLNHLPLNTTIDDVFEFFGRDGIEGLFIGNYFGYIQFKRPLDLTNALKKHNTDFKGVRIIVVRDVKFRDKQSTLPSSSSDSRLSHTNGGSRSGGALNGRSTNGRRISVSPPARRSSLANRLGRPRSRSPGWGNIRGRSRSQSRDRAIPYSASPRSSSYRGRSRSRSSERFGGGSSSSLQGNHHSRIESDRHLMGPAPMTPWRHPLSSYSNEFREAVSAEQAFMVPSSQPITSQLALISPVELPNSIDLSLKLVISQKTAKGLTVSQIQDIINYFETEKAALQHLNGTFVSTNLNVPTQQRFYQPNTPAAITYPTTNDNPASQLRPAQFSAPRQPEPTQALDVVQQEELEDVMRLIRDSTR